MTILGTVTGIVCHVSASGWGDKAIIDQWHRERGWSQIGYHGVILNGVRTYQAGYDIALDGVAEAGRSEAIMGAHCLAKGMNRYTIGVCCIGNPGWASGDVELAPPDIIKAKRKYLTQRQLTGLVRWLAENCRQYDLDPLGTFTRASDGRKVPVITQHSDHDTEKPFCASLVLPELRQLVATEIGRPGQ